MAGICLVSTNLASSRRLIGLREQALPPMVKLGPGQIGTRRAGTGSDGGLLLGQSRDRPLPLTLAIQREIGTGNGKADEEVREKSNRPSYKFQLLKDQSGN